MSTCPDLDLYSVYLDNELPEQFKEKLEAHLERCSVCQEKFNKMKAIHNVFVEDSSSIVISDKALEDSFVKLQAKRSYNSFIRKTSRRNEFFLRRVVPAMAAALILALVIPLRILGVNESPLKTDLKTFNYIPELLSSVGISTESGLRLKSAAAAPASDSTVLNTPLYNTDLTSALQNQILTSIDIFGSDIKTNKIQITIDLSNVSGIKSSEKDAMKLIQIPVTYSPEGQK
ncbi:MAG: zf-HC2 domain-containing protein [Treponemataceae bacterium]|nr:zf-HC2 domain-containing protein [Treponemataceae bacterium]